MEEAAHGRRMILQVVAGLTRRASTALFPRRARTAATPARSVAPGRRRAALEEAKPAPLVTEKRRPVVRMEN